MIGVAQIVRFFKRLVGVVALALLAGVLGVVMALLIRSVLFALTACQQVLWNVLPSMTGVGWLPLLTCALGGLAIGLWTKRFDATPEPLGKVVGSVRATGAYRLASIPASIVGFALPVTFGGCVGPCAGVCGIVAALGTSIGDLLRRAGWRVREAEDLGLSAAFSAVFGAPFAGIVAGGEASPEIVREQPLRLGVRIVLYSAAAGGAFAGLMLFRMLAGAGGGLPRLVSTGFAARDIPWMLVCLAAAWALALVFVGVQRGFGRLAARLHGHPVAKAVMCGVAIGAVGVVFPFALFSGEEQVAQIASGWQAMPAAMLLVAAVAKAVLTPLCMQFGWRGGPLFPCVFAGVALGYGVALLAGVDPVCCAAVASGAFIACVTRRPLLAAALVVLCFPPQSLVWLLIAAFVGGHLPLPKGGNGGVR